MLALARADPIFEGISAELALDDGVGPAVADQELLTQVALNLLRNAAEAAGPGGRVRLGVERTRAGGVAVMVEDDGPGMPPDLRGDVLLPFFTTEEGGSGIGLSLSRQIVLAHGGAMTIEDSGLWGAAVRVVL